MTEMKIQADYSITSPALTSPHDFDSPQPTLRIRKILVVTWLIEYEMKIHPTTQAPDVTYGASHTRGYK